MKTEESIGFHERENMVENTVCFLFVYGVHWTLGKNGNASCQVIRDGQLKFFVRFDSFCPSKN